MKILALTKRILVLIASLCLTLATTLLIGCKDENTVKFVDFDDITVKVAYGSNTSLLQYATAVDEDGKAYRCSVAVSDAQGNPVEVVFDRFNVTSMDGYSAVTTVIGYDVSRKIDIVVEDRSNIFIEDFSDKLFTGYVGQEYTMPEVQISKVSGEIIDPVYKVYLLENDKQVEMEVTDYAFTPEKRGVYILEVSATDAIGVTATKTAKFNVRLSMMKNMLEDFNDELSVSTLKASKAWGATEQIKYGEGFYTDWHENYDGRQGVVESALNTNLNNKRICTTFSFDSTILSEMVDSMSDSDYISIWFWLDKDGKFDAIRQEDPSDSSTWTVLAKVEGQKWQEIKIYKKALTRKFAEWHCNSGSGDQLFFFYNTNQSLSGVKYYIDSISLIKAKLNGDTMPKLNQEYALPQLSLCGIKGEIISVDSDIECSLSYSDITVPVQDNKITITTAGKYDIVYKYQIGGVDCEYVNNYYVDDNIPMGAEYVQDFSKNWSADNITTSNNMNSYTATPFYVKWHEEFEGKSGVVETITNDGSTQRRVCGMNEDLLAMADRMDDNDYISMWVYLASSNKYQFVLNKIWGDNVGIPHVQGGQWSEIKLSKAVLSNANASGEMLMCFFNNANGNDKEQIKVYIDEIKLVIDNTSLDVIEDFSSSDSTIRIVASNDMNSYTTTPFYVTWHEEFEGHSGVVETITNDGSAQRRVCGMNAELLGMADRMDDNDYVSIWVYIADTTYNYQFVLSPQVWGDNYNMPKIQGGAWQEIKLYKTILTDPNASGERLLGFYRNETDKAQLKVYIDDIRLVVVD